MKLLFISFFFPPMGGAAVQRPAKWVKYLERIGWETTVISVEEYEYHHRDDTTLLKDIPTNVNVIRIPLRTSSHLICRALYRLKFRSIGDFLGRYWLDYPDHTIHWCKKVALNIKEGLIGDEYDAILTTSLPGSVNILGRNISKYLDIPWFADFRDELSSLPHLDKVTRLRMKQIERTTCENAAGCIFAHPVVMREFQDKYNLPAKRSLLLENGFDEEDFENLDIRSREDRQSIHISHVGSFQSNNKGLALCKAFSSFPKDKTIERKITLNFIGGAPYCQIASIDNIEVRVSERLSHDTAIKLMLSADILLIICDSTRLNGIIPGKLFEYLATGKPILSIAPGGSDLHRYVKDYGDGWTVDSNDPDAIASTIIDISADFHPITEIVAAQRKMQAMPFSRKLQVSRLAEFLENTVSGITTK